MKRIAVFVEDHYQVLEVWYPYLYLKGEGFETVFVGSGRAKTYQSKEGYTAREELSIAKADPVLFDAVVIPGGYAPDMMRRNPASAGILKGKKATSYFAIKDDVTNAGATWLDKEVVVDGNLITSRHPYDLPAFCKQIAAALK
jgi:protease I